ncbi:MAG: hypothetical protein ACRCYY_12205 [Trueperaceae bacterium]
MAISSCGNFSNPRWGIRYIRLHDHRHTYITTARDKGMRLLA